MRNRYYPDGTKIPMNLPQSYMNHNSQGVPLDQRCDNCVYYDNGLCRKFLATVKDYYWCKFWEKR